MGAWVPLIHFPGFYISPSLFFFFLLSYLINETPCFLGHVLLLRNCQHTQLTISYPYTPSTSSWAKLWACWASLSLSSSAEKVESCVFFYEMPSPKRIHLGSDFSTSEASFNFLGFLITYIVLFYHVSISQLYCRLLFGCLFLFLPAMIGFNWRPINCMALSPIAIFAGHTLAVHKSIIKKKYYWCWKSSTAAAFLYYCLIGIAVIVFSLIPTWKRSFA